MGRDWITGELKDKKLMARQALVAGMCEPFRRVSGVNTSLKKAWAWSGNPKAGLASVISRSACWRSYLGVPTGHTGSQPEPCCLLAL